MYDPIRGSFADKGRGPPPGVNMNGFLASIMGGGAGGAAAPPPQQSSGGMGGMGALGGLLGAMGGMGGGGGSQGGGMGLGGLLGAMGGGMLGRGEGGGGLMSGLMGALMSGYTPARDVTLQSRELPVDLLVCTARLFSTEIMCARVKLLLSFTRLTPSFALSAISR